MRRLHQLLWSLLLALTLSTYSNAQPQHTPKQEYRAVWLTTIKGLDWPREADMGNSAAQQAHLCTILDSLQAIHINTILLQTRIRGDVIYPSAIEPFAPVFTGRHGVAPDYDPLAFAIEECHKRGMQLHAWLVTIPLGDAAYVKGHGRQSLPSKHPKQCTKAKGAWYMEPSHPATAEHLSALVEEIVTHYDVDGIHFDYIRYPEGLPLAPSQRGGTAAWRRANITHLMRTLYAKIKSIEPWVCVSAATLGKHADVARYSSYGWNAYHTVHQEAQEWLREGIADALFPMLYYDGRHFYPFVTDWYEHSYGRHIVAGMGTYQLHPREKNWDLETFKRQFHVVRAHPIAGAAQFRSLFVTDNTKGVYDLLGTLYPYPALVPAMPWLNDTPPSPPTGLTVSIDKEETTLTWNREEGVSYNIYSSNTYPVDIAQPMNLYRAYSRDTCYTTPTVSIVRPRHYAITAIDRFGNESEPLQWEHRVKHIEPKNIDLNHKKGTLKVYTTHGSTDGDVARHTPFEPKKRSDWRLVFSDEFNGEDHSQPAANKWMRCQRQGATWNRWLSDSEEVVYIEDGELVTRAIPNPDKSEDPVDMITGGIKSMGHFGFTYGYVEARILTTPWPGNFPAFWMMPENTSGGWPDCGEIDIWETIDTENRSYHTIHSNWTYDLGHTDKPRSGFNVSTSNDRYHIYGLEWNEHELIWYVDGKEVGRYAKSESADALAQGQWPFDKHFYLILNQSVGNGSWAERADVNHTYETRFDWVRVYQKVGMRNTNGIVKKKEKRTSH